MPDAITAARAAYNDPAASEAKLRVALGALLALVEGPAIALTMVGLVGRSPQGRPAGKISVAGVEGTVHLVGQQE